MMSREAWQRLARQSAQTFVDGKKNFAIRQLCKGFERLTAVDEKDCIKVCCKGWVESRRGAK